MIIHNGRVSSAELLRKILNVLTIMSLLVLIGGPSAAAAQQAEPVTSGLSYADVADLASAAPLIAKARIRSVKDVRIAGANPGDPARTYHLITARVDSLIRGTGGIAPQVRFLVAPAEGIANSPVVRRWRRGATVLIFALPAAQPGQVQLVSRNALQPWSAGIEATTRAVVTEMLGPNPVPAVLEVGDAFHVPGTVQGEGETQIFLKTVTGAPVSLSILRRPGEAAQWGVSLGEIVDDAAVPPARDTLLWYRLACALPDALPASSTRAMAMLDAEAARRDYRLVMESLGRCGRTL